MPASMIYVTEDSEHWSSSNGLWRHQVDAAVDDN